MPHFGNIKLKKYLSLFFISQLTQVHTLEDFLTLTTPKVAHLLQILRKYKPDDNFTIVPGNYDDDGDDVEDDDVRKDGDDDEEEEDDDDKVMSQVGWSRAGKVGGQGVSCVVVKKEDGVFVSLFFGFLSKINFFFVHNY